MTGGNKNPKESLKDVAALYNDQLARPVKEVVAPVSVATATKMSKRPAGLDLPAKKRVKRGRVRRGGGGVGGG